MVLVCLQLVAMLTVYRSVLSSDHPRDEVRVTQPLNCRLIAMKGIRKEMPGASSMRFPFQPLDAEMILLYFSRQISSSLLPKTLIA